MPRRRGASLNMLPGRLLAMHAATRTAIFRRLKAANPSPTTELLHDAAFELLVAVMLSAHTTDRSVNAATRTLPRSGGTGRPAAAPPDHSAAADVAPRISREGSRRGRARAGAAVCDRCDGDDGTAVGIWCPKIVGG